MFVIAPCLFSAGRRRGKHHANKYFAMKATRHSTSVFPTPFSPGRKAAAGRWPLAALLFFPMLLLAQVHRVPADFSSIQAAVNAAQEGDTVLVSPGTYYENVQLRGRNIVLTSRYFLENDPAAVIRQTIIDGSQPVHADTASCILIWKGETAATVIQGFTLRGGQGTRWYDHYVPGYFREGGGILSEFSSPVIRHNIIRDNTVPKVGASLISYGGGGIRAGDGAPRIENNYIVHNRADGYGGGIVLNYCPGAVIENNIIAFNYGGKDYSGGGFWATGQDQSTVNVLRNNTIVYNQSPAGSSQYNGKGGGVWVFSIKLQAENNIVWGNTQVSGKQIASAGALVQAKYNLVETGFGGAGTISLDPMFRDTLGFVLEAGSPAADAGNPDPAYDDFSRNARRAAFPARGSLRSDMGAYGGPDPSNPAFGPSMGGLKVFSKVLNSPVTTTPGDSRSVNWVDVDGDHDFDLFISNGPEVGENNFLYINNGSGGFTLLTNDPIVQDGKPSDGATWGDYDNDGDADCFVANWHGVNNLFYKNKGNGTFEQVTTGQFVNDAGYSETASWGDYDNDGRLDLYVTNSSGDKRNFLYHNDGNGNFTRITAGTPVNDAFLTRSVNWTDFDDDGDVDIFVTNESGQNENLYRNDGNNGSFAKLTAAPLLTNAGSTMSSSWGDYNNDGKLDVFLANDLGNDALFRNDGNEAFTKITGDPVVTSGGNSFGSQWADVDNDADLDLFVTNAFHGNAWKNFLFWNNGNGTFTRDTGEVCSKELGWSYGCAFGDFDRDGDLDLGVANCYDAVQPDYLYENHSSESINNWLAVDCIGNTSNRSAIGAKVLVTATIGGQTVTQLREISAQSGYCGQNQLAAHFGLADATTYSVTVKWPSGIEQTFGNLLPNQYITIVEGQDVTGISSPNGNSAGLQVYPPVPNPFHDSLVIRWEQQAADQVFIEVTDLLGKRVVSQALQTASGQQEWRWNGLDGRGVPVADGAYVVALKGKTFSTAVKVIKG